MPVHNSLKGSVLSKIARIFVSLSEQSPEPDRSGILLKVKLLQVLQTHQNTACSTEMLCLVQAGSM